MARLRTHPGEILREEFLMPLGMSARALAKLLDVPANRLTEIMRGTRDVSADTALRLGVQNPQRTLFEPETNLRTGARYLRLLLDRFPGSTELALAAYNAGGGAVHRYGGIPPYAETQAYVPKVQRAMAALGG